MAKSSSYSFKKKLDINEIAALVVRETTQETPKHEVFRIKTVGITKNPAAVELGRLGGLKGGKARAEKLSMAKKKEIAKKGAAARWK